MKTALVLEGGASRALFTCGVIDTLLENDVRADYLIGVSAGISYGIDYASGQIGRSRRLALEYMHDKRYMGFKYMFNRRIRSIYNTDFVFRDIPDIYVPFDYDSFANFKGEMYAGVTDLETGRAEYIGIPRDRDGSEKLLRASCALPILFRPQEFNGRLYMDGGIADSVPFLRAFEDGCDKIIVVRTRERSYRKSREGATPIVERLFKNYPRFVEAFDARPEKYNQAAETLEEYERDGRIIVIAPRDTRGFKRTERRSEMLEKIYNEGRHEATAALDKIYAYLK